MMTPLVCRALAPLCLASFVSLTASAADVGVRIRFGLTDKEPEVWNGTVSVQPGRVVSLSGWRFEQDDKVNGITGWTASTRAAGDFRTNAQKAKAKANAAKANGGKKGGAAAKAKAKAGAANTSGLADNGVVLALEGVNEDSTVTLKTEQGDITFKLSEIPYGKYIERNNGGVQIERVAATRPLTTDAKTDHDYPAAAAGADGAVFVTYQSFTPGIDRNERAQQRWQSEPDDLKFLSQAPGGDQLLVRIIRGGTSGEEIAVTEKGADIYRSAVAVAGDGTAWIFWSQNSGYKAFPNNGTASFDIWARPLTAGKLGQAVKISASSESDIWPVAATDSTGKVWVAWQGARGGVFKILARRQEGSGFGAEQTVSPQSRSCWAPAIATTENGGGKIAIAWDTYDKGDYDIWLREFDTSGQAGEARPAANTEDYEARPALAYDMQGALWVAYEQSGPTWGKDWSGQAPFENRNGIGLYKDRQIGIAVLKQGQWMEPEQLIATALPGADPRRRRGTEAAAARPLTGPLAEDEGAVIRNVVHNNLARLVCDRGGRIWVLARAKQNDFRAQIGSVWMDYAVHFDGNQWIGPVLIPHTDNLLYNSPAPVALPSGGLLIAHSSDHRQSRHLPRGEGGNASLPGRDPFDNDLYISRLESAGDAKPATLIAARVPPNPSAQPSADTQKERAEIERIRGYRAMIGGQELRITRGEFHRHTEISGDGGNDGPLEDMWRYAIDVANMEWLGCSDHDNGNGREYTWWLTQKTTDAFRLAGVFDPPYCYERSVPYPEGHRNIVFTRRGIRTLPRLPISDRNNEIHAPDTQMLYKYLKLFDGVCASHTSATTMGTDWRDSDGLVEPMVEIYQGCRMNYERPGAPRAPTADFNLGGFEAKGFINLALLKGIKFSFQSSSDHGSTHISYALVYAENNSREAMFAAMKKRHTYAATDNIIADYRCEAGGKQYMMGDAFKTDQPPTVKIKFIGTAPLAKVTLVKDDVEIVLGEPNKQEVEYTWTDPAPQAGKESYYYVRGEQADGEIVWASPMWITYQPK